MVAVRGIRGAQYMLVSTHDISERKRSEAASREAEARLCSALDASGVGSWSWSMLTGALVWDARMCEIWGLQATPESYAAYLATFHPDDLERVKALVEQFLTSGRFEEFEHRIIRPSGEVRHVQCRAVAVVDAHGTTVGMRGGVFDVTERKLLEERLRNAHRLQAVGQLTAGIAHNFNNLLGIILPSVELCREALPGLVMGHLDDIENAAERAAEMVRQLMQFGRHELGAPKRAVGLREIVTRLLNICRTTFEPRIVIECDVPAELPPILASTGEIEQVLLNVCINARDALTSAKIEAPLIRLEFDQELPGFVRVRISDNGPGMRSEVRARIFEPFFTTKGLGSGTGLGLASAYGIMRDHGGMITCDSQPGRGSSFTLQLPVAPPSALEEPRTKMSVPRASNAETILLVDDELALRRVLRIILEQAGFHVLEAEDGLAGLEVVESRGNEIDLVVLDRSMPRMSGDQFLVELRRRKLKLPIVVLTGHPGRDAASDEVAAVLLKPVASGELVRTIRSVLDRTRANVVS
jgi:two-component system, cell cycle sensor histidine kinase and response regulator CckA